MKRRPVAPRLLALAAAGWLLFDFPLLQLVARQPLAVFALWALLIAALAVVIELGDD